MSDKNDGNENVSVDNLQVQNIKETKIVVESKSEGDVINKETKIMAKKDTEAIINNDDNDKPDDESSGGKSDEKDVRTMVTTTAQIPGEIAVEFDKVVIVAVGTIKGKRKEEGTVTEKVSPDVIVPKKGPKKKSLFGRDFQVYCAGQPCCMDCCVRLNYCCDGPQRNCFVAYMMLYYFVMQAATSYFMYYLLRRRRDYLRNNNTRIIIVSVVTMILINYIMLCLACGNHCLLSFLLLVLTVVAYSWLLAALSVRYDTDMFWYVNTSLALVALFLLLLAFTCYDFTNCRLRAYIVLVAIVSFYLVHYWATQYYRLELFRNRRYPQRTMLLFYFMTILHALLLVTTLRRLLCCCFIEIGICDYAIGAYILYTMWLQQILCLLHMGSAREC